MKHLTTPKVYSITSRTLILCYPVVVVAVAVAVAAVVVVELLFRFCNIVLLPEQLNPSPKYPPIQVQVKFPGVLVQ